MIQPQPNSPSGTIPYEQRLDADRNWALLEGSAQFDESNSVHKVLRKLAGQLDVLGIAYAVAGDLAMFFHGFRRCTEIIEILFTSDGIHSLHQQCENLGYVTADDGSLDLRDIEHGVRIHAVIAGHPPLPDLPMPIQYPDPATASVQIGNRHILALPRLIDLKLAWGMKGTRHLRQLADVQELIDHLELPRNFADQLDPTVRGKFWELWMDVQNDPCKGMY